MGRPRLLDLYCCEGGAGMGYHRAGFEVVGVDLDPKYRKRYPFEFHAADAIEFVKEHGHEFDAIHASPPCQHASAGTRAQDRSRYPRLIPPTRDVLIASGLPYVIENVRGADLLDPVELCGCMFDLTAVDDDGVLLHLQRGRRFESNVPLTVPRPCDHSDHEWVGGSYGGARRDKYEAKYVRHGGYVPSKAVQERLLGIDWMTQYGLYQSLPPVYTEHIGLQVLAHILTTAAGLTEPEGDTGVTEQPASITPEGHAMVEELRYGHNPAAYLCAERPDCAPFDSDALCIICSDGFEAITWKRRAVKAEAELAALKGIS